MQFSIYLFLFLLKFTFSKKKNSGTLSDCQTVWDPDQDRQHIGPDLRSLQGNFNEHHYDLIVTRIKNVYVVWDQDRLQPEELYWYIYCIKIFVSRCNTYYSGRVLDSRPKGRGFEPHRRHCVVSLSKNINPSLVLVQPRKTRPFITERLLMGRKKSNQTNKTIRITIQCFDSKKTP